jgi:hypothetical protein
MYVPHPYPFILSAPTLPSHKVDVLKLKPQSELENNTQIPTPPKTIYGMYRSPSFITL